MSKIKEIFKVRYIKDDHDENPDWYPPKGTVGTVVEIDEEGIWVDWPEGSTHKRGPWMCRLEDVEILKVMGGDLSC